MERCRVLDDVIGRHDQQDRVRVGRGRKRCQRYGRRRVTAFRLEHDLRVRVDIAQLLGDQETVRLVADDEALAWPHPPYRSARKAVSCSIVCFAEVSGSSCFGYIERDAGQSRVPEPPDRITGWI